MLSITTLRAFVVFIKRTRIEKKVMRKGMFILP